MNYYRFKTFTTSYYFPKLNADQQYMYGLYSPYGGKLSRAYWWLFRMSGLVRCLTSVKEADLPFHYQKIKQIDGTDCLMSFNMGSPGVEQKISILGYDNKRGNPFFAKFSEKPVAMKLTENEIKVYQLLSETGLTPRLLKAITDRNYAYLKAEYVKGCRPQSRMMTDAIVKLCLSLASYHFDISKDYGNLKHSLSHGDFCPWNMLCNEGDLRLIDWELADERPLGYDLFTYICNVSTLFEPETPLIVQIDRNIIFVKDYFMNLEIEDYLPYLRSFSQIKYDYEYGKGNSILTQQYKQLKESL